MQWIKASHPGLQKIPVPPSGHPSCEAILVDMGDDKAAQHKEHVHGQIALVHRSGIALGMNGWDVPAKVKYYDPERGDAAQRGQGSKLLDRPGRPLAPGSDSCIHRPETGLLSIAI